jgi:hypothetical protein
VNEWGCLKEGVRVTDELNLLTKASGVILDVNDGGLRDGNTHRPWHEYSRAMKIEQF